MTPTEASISESNCSVIAPGYYASVMVNGSVQDMRPCPQGYYCPGGQVLQAFTPDTPNPDLAPPVGTIFKCPYDMWTIDVGSTAPEQCCK
jgi:hypothetical protein